jgi:hypothetical protein
MRRSQLSPLGAVLCSTPLPLFHHSEDEHAAPAVSPELDAELQRLAALPLAELAAEALQLGFTDQAPLPDSEKATTHARVLVGEVWNRYIDVHPQAALQSQLGLSYMREACGALLAAGLVTLAFDTGAISTNLILTREGRAALDRGDAAEVVARRLPA